jgi:hypothetical protein
MVQTLRECAKVLHFYTCIAYLNFPNRSFVVINPKKINLLYWLNKAFMSLNTFPFFIIIVTLKCCPVLCLRDPQVEIILGRGSVGLVRLCMVSAVPEYVKSASSEDCNDYEHQFFPVTHNTT